MPVLIDPLANYRPRMRTPGAPPQETVGDDVGIPTPVGGFRRGLLPMDGQGSFQHVKPGGSGDRSGSTFNFAGWSGGAPGSGIRPLNTGALAGVGGDVSSMISDYLKGVIQGGQTRYSPDVVDRMKSEAKSAAMGSARAARESTSYDLVRRGMFQSPAGNRPMDEINRRAEASYSGAVNQIQIQKTNADFEDRMGALDRAQRWLDQLRSYTLGLEGLAADREKAQAAIALGYARLDQERAALQAQMGLQERQFDFYRWLNTTPIGLPGGGTRNVPANQIPYLMGGSGGY